MDNKEIWKRIEGYEKQYAISNQGRVKSLPRSVRFTMTNYRRIPPRILKQKTHPNGTKYVMLSNKNVKSYFTIKTLVKKHFHDQNQ